MTGPGAVVSTCALSLAVRCHKKRLSPTSCWRWISLGAQGARRCNLSIVKGHRRGNVQAGPLSRFLEKEHQTPTGHAVGKKSGWKKKPGEIPPPDGTKVFDGCVCAIGCNYGHHTLMYASSCAGPYASSYLETIRKHGAGRTGMLYLSCCLIPRARHMS